MTVFSVYEELMYGDQDDGSCHWTGRLYNRVGPGVVKETTGVAVNREEARESFKSWCEVEKAEYQYAETRIVDGAKVFLTQDELDSEKEG